MWPVGQSLEGRNEEEKRNVDTLIDLLPTSLLFFGTNNPNKSNGILADEGWTPHVSKKETLGPLSNGRLSYIKKSHQIAHWLIRRQEYSRNVPSPYSYNKQII